MGALQAATFLAACHNILLCGFWICFCYMCFSTVSGGDSWYWSVDMLLKMLFKFIYCLCATN